MENKIINTIGSITKIESLIPVDFNILNHTCVLEAKTPYADYYGLDPFVSKPHSIFLLTKEFYQLNEIIDLTKDIKVCFSKHQNLDVATAIIDFVDHYCFAIRVRDFPDYKHIHWLQSCYISRGVHFIKKIEHLRSAKITVCKQFSIQAYKEGIYFDLLHPHKGYITLPNTLTENEFYRALVYARNNENCELFDAAPGTLDMDLKTIEAIRIFSENLKPIMLENLRTIFIRTLEEKKTAENIEVYTILKNN